MTATDRHRPRCKRCARRLPARLFRHTPTGQRSAVCRACERQLLEEWAT